MDAVKVLTGTLIGVGGVVHVGQGVGQPILPMLGSLAQPVQFIAGGVTVLYVLGEALD